MTTTGPTDDRLTVAYVRTGTPGDAMGDYSIRVKEMQCTTYALAQRWPVVSRVFIDDGVSGLFRNREGLGQLMTVARSGVIEWVIMTRLDRLGRTTGLILELEDELTRYGVQRVYIATGLDTATEAGRASIATPPFHSTHSCAISL